MKTIFVFGLVLIDSRSSECDAASFAVSFLVRRPTVSRAVQLCKCARVICRFVCLFSTGATPLSAVVN